MKAILKFYKQFFLLFKFRLLTERVTLLMFIISQLTIVIGYIIGVGLILQRIDSDAARYLITGNPIIIILSAGLLNIPMGIAGARIQGSFEYLLSLPIQRIIFILVDSFLYLILTIPGLILSLIIGTAYYNLPLHINLMVLPTLVIVSATGTFIGYTIGLGSPRPQMVITIAQLFFFMVVLFSPINYPIDNLPTWLAAVNRALPMHYMAELARKALTGMNINLTLAFAVIGLWCFASFILTNTLINRRL